MDIKDIYNRFDEPVLLPELELEDIILRYFRACPLHQNDSKVAYIVLTENEYNHLYDNDEIKLTNVDIALQAGYPQLLPAYPLTSAGNRCDQLQDHIMCTSWHQ